MTMHVTFKVGNASYVVPASDVLHLESFEAATHVPGAPAYVAGLVQVRSRLVPVIDLRVRFGLPPIAHSIDRRVVVVQCGARVAGFLVDSAREVLKIPPGDFQPPPPVVVQQTDGLVKGVVQAGNRLLMLIDFTKVIGEEQEHGQ